MRSGSVLGAIARWSATGVILCIGAWAGYAGLVWMRYGQVERGANPDETDTLMDRFMPVYEVAERHRTRVSASAETTFEAGATLDLRQSRIIRAIFDIRAIILGADRERNRQPWPLLTWAKEMGWGVLAEVRGREVVFGAVTKPWEANVVFRALPRDAFLAFREPDYVKIAWTLRADPVSASESIARTETRVVTTDAGARAKFRRYWACFSPGIVLIRRISLQMVKEESERRARQSAPEQAVSYAH